MYGCEEEEEEEEEEEGVSVSLATSGPYYTEHGLHYL
jgi:hypothetical protein